MIANEILQNIGDQHILIYYPTTKSVKHGYYFNKIKTVSKYFLPWRPLRWSDTLTGLLAWWRIPRWIRRKKYRSLYISSLGDIPFSLLAGRNGSASIHTFDDGNFNLNKEMFFWWINHEPTSYLMVKYFMNGDNNKKLFERIVCHHTIYPKKMLLWMQCKIKEVDLFRNSFSDVHVRRDRKKIRVLLGSWFVDSRLNNIHNDICKSTRFDLFVPHPASELVERMCSQIKDVFGKNELKFLVAEDIIIKLVRNGYYPIVYGFNSSALITIKKYAAVVSINIDESFSWAAEDLRKFRIKVLGC